MLNIVKKLEPPEPPKDEEPPKEVLPEGNFFHNNQVEFIDITVNN